MLRKTRVWAWVKGLFAEEGCLPGCPVGRPPGQPGCDECEAEAMSRRAW